MGYYLEGEFMKKIKDWRYGLPIGGRDTDLIQIAWYLSHAVKDFFPINGVPQNVINSIQSLRERFTLAEEQFHLTLDVIINEVEKLDDLEG